MLTWGQAVFGTLVVTTGGIIVAVAGAVLFAVSVCVSHRLHMLLLCYYTIIIGHSNEKEETT